MVLFTLSAVLLGGCRSDITTPEAQTTSIRSINAVTNLNTTTAAGDAIDVLLDSSTSLAGTERLKVNTATPYVEIPVGVHSFAVRISGLNPAGVTLFTDATRAPYLPKQHLTTGTNYTFLPVGIYPGTGELAAGAIAPVIIRDDPYAPPIANGKYQSRFKFINAAPYASGSDGIGASVALFVTPGTSPLTSVSGLRSQTSSPYRRASIYVDLTGGNYVMTFAVGTRILSSVPMTLIAGEVRTLVLLNSLAVVAPAQSGPQNHTVLNLLDAKF